MAIEGFARSGPPAYVIGEDTVMSEPDLAGAAW
jgi:hypothetical protein